MFNLTIHKHYESGRKSTHVGYCSVGGEKLLQLRIQMRRDLAQMNARDNVKGISYTLTVKEKIN